MAHFWTHFWNPMISWFSGVSWHYHIYIILTHFLTPFYYHLDSALRWFGPIKGVILTPFLDTHILTHFWTHFLTPFISIDPPLLWFRLIKWVHFWTHFMTFFDHSMTDSTLYSIKYYQSYYLIHEVTYDAPVYCHYSVSTDWHCSNAQFYYHHGSQHNQYSHHRIWGRAHRGTQNQSLATWWVTGSGFLSYLEM